jgi:hypothetical protein
VSILRKQGNTHLVEQVGGQGPFRVTLLTERTLNADAVVWRAAGGDLRRNDGMWRVQPVSGGTVLYYRVHVIPKQSVPAGVVGFLQRQALPEMIHAIRRRAESVAASSPQRSIVPVGSP